MADTTQKLTAMYETMLNCFGPQHWWPGEEPLEIMIGAVLTQNTNWKNVEKAIENLRRNNMIDIEKLVTIPTAKLAELIRPAGYFTVKAKRLQNLMNFIFRHYDADLSRFFSLPIYELREQLLSVSGIGQETADDIVLYAAEKPTFVVDTYTYRIMLRHFLIDQDADYATIKQVFEDNLPADVKMFNEYHALLVAVGKNYCKPRNPQCSQCPLNRYKHNANLPEEF